MLKFEITNKTETITRELGEGSHKIGRASSCDIQLKSASVSKQHALLVVKGSRAAIVDLGSSNGVFVNGILVRKHRIEPGDEIVISEYKIKFVSPNKAKAHATAKGSNETSYESGNLARNLAKDPNTDLGTEETPEELPPQEKLRLIIDSKILSPFYTLMGTADWRALLLGILGGTLILAVFLSIIPVVRWGRNITISESLARAHTIVTQAVRENYRVMLKTNDYSRLTVESCEAEKSILGCLIVDPKSNTVLAPVKNLNQPISDIYMSFAVKKILEKEDESPSIEKNNGNYIVAQPIIIQGKDDGEKNTSAIVVAEYEIPSKVYSTFEPIVESALFAILCSLVAYFLIYKMFTHPILQMHDQLDAALKGEDVSVTSSAKNPELESLATVINFSVSRMRQAGGGIVHAVSASDAEAENSSYEKTIEEFDQITSDALLLLDRDNKVSYVGKILEDMLSMRNQYAKGQNISDACRDQSFAGTAIDMADRVKQTLGETQNAQLDINGITRNMGAVAHKNTGQEICYILITVKMGG